MKKSVLITGAARRLGRELALAFAHAQWNVAVHFGQSAQEAEGTVADINRIGAVGVSLGADLTDEAAVNEVIKRAGALIGPLHCLVNNAAVFEYDDVRTASFASLERALRINTCAPIVLARHFAEQVPKGTIGCVVNLLDQKLFNLNPDFFSYTITKAALQAATTLLAQALAPGVRVVGVAPGLTLVSGDQSAAGFERAHRVTALGQSSTAHDVCQAVLFAADCRALTGTTLLVDGGQHLIPLPRDVMFLTEPTTDDNE